MVFLLDLPADILDLILQWTPASAIELWKSGDHLVRHKLVNGGCTELRLQDYNSHSTSRWPKFINSVTHLRLLSIIRDGTVTHGDPLIDSFIEPLPKSLSVVSFSFPLGHHFLLRPSSMDCSPPRYAFLDLISMLPTLKDLTLQLKETDSIIIEASSFTQLPSSLLRLKLLECAVEESIDLSCLPHLEDLELTVCLHHILSWPPQLIRFNGGPECYASLLEMEPHEATTMLSRVPNSLISLSSEAIVLMDLEHQFPKIDGFTRLFNSIMVGSWDYLISRAPIGLENLFPSLTDLTLVTSPLSYAQLLLVPSTVRSMTCTVDWPSVEQTLINQFEIDISSIDLPLPFPEASEPVQIMAQKLLLALKRGIVSIPMWPRNLVKLFLWCSHTSADPSSELHLALLPKTVRDLSIWVDLNSESTFDPSTFPHLEALFIGARGHDLNIASALSECTHLRDLGLNGIITLAGDLPASLERLNLSGPRFFPLIESGYLPSTLRDLSLDMSSILDASLVSTPLVSRLPSSLKKFVVKGRKVLIDSITALPPGIEEIEFELIDTENQKRAFHFPSHGFML